jgi:hypothetical protein
MLQPALAKSQLCRAMASACPPEELRLGIVLFIIKRPPSRLTHWYPLVQLVLLGSEEATHGTVHAPVSFDTTM